MSPQKILLRMPNWLGDVVMATAFIEAVNQIYPGATVDLIMKKGLEFLGPHLPNHNKIFVFDKKEFPGATGAFKFGKKLKAEKYNLFFCLPVSFSSALMGYGSKAKERIGFAKEWRNLLLTKTFTQPIGLHRVEEYVYLLEAFTGKKITQKKVLLKANVATIKDQIIVNINSEASSRRLPKEKAISLLTKLRSTIDQEIFLIGSPKEEAFVTEVITGLPDKNGITNLAGKTSMTALTDLISESKLLLTTDSGPAHVGNALGVFTIVLFGAGNENNTGPYDVTKREIIRLRKLKCEPCLKNVCPLYEEPHCLTLLNDEFICNQVKEKLENGK